MIVRRRFALALSVAALAVPLGAEDLTVVSKTSIGDRVGTSTQYMTSTRSRSTDGQTDSIVEFSTGRFLFIDHNTKEYWESSTQEMATYFDRAEKANKGNPAFDAMFGGANDVVVEKGKRSRKVAGYDCDEYTMRMGRALVFELCAAKGLEAPAKYFEGRKASFAAMGPLGKWYAKMFDEMKKIKGYPLSVAIDLDMGTMKQHTVSEATEVRKGPIPASTFEIPAGYKKKPSPFGK